jgi:hypothetical protein
MTSHLPDHDVVEADVNYLLYTGQRPSAYAYPPPPGVPQRTGVPDVRRVQIANARRLAALPTLDANGFERRSHATAVTDFSDEQQIRTVYYREVEDILRQATGAEKVVIFDHTLRSSAAQRDDATREPVRFVHNDQTFVSGPRRVRDHLPPDEAAERLGGRFAIINLWRPIASTVETWPLAVLDGRTLETDDLVASDLIYRDKVGETYAVLHRARHRWFYFPRLRPDELVLLKIYDSQADGPVRLSAHTAFEDPTSPPDAPPRRSIEVRSLVFWRSIDPSVAPADPAH